MAAIPVRWPNGRTTKVEVGKDWLEAANAAGVSIPTGCMRACITTVPAAKSGQLCVEFATDPFW